MFIICRKNNPRSSTANPDSMDPDDPDNQAAKAYQTIKCMMTLKRKLKNLRLDKQHHSREVDGTELEKDK
jgi:hypothetical protein